MGGKPIKITYMIDIFDSDLGGTENQLIKIINGLDENKFKVELICFKDHPWFEANAKLLNCSSRVVDINSIKKLYTYSNFIRLVKFLKRSTPDIVQTFFPMGNIAGVLAARLAGVKTIISSRRDYGEWMTPGYIVATRFANIFVDRIIANSNMVKEITVKKERCDPSKIEVLYNGIDIEAFTSLARDDQLKRKIGMPSSNKVVTIVANFRPMKHHKTFITAAKLVLEKRADVSFLLIGTGELKEKMERHAIDTGIEANLFFLGSQKDVASFLSFTDIGVNCSEGEGLSNAVIEYMCSGVPCIVSEAGGNTDLIKNGLNGYTFKLDSARAIADLILSLFDDQVAIERFKRNALQDVRASMSLDAMIAKYEDCYSRLNNADT